MSADPGTRDAQVAEEIKGAENAVNEVLGTVANLVAHARSEDAEAHARLYEDVERSLATAARLVRHAHQTMLNADPEDFA